MSQLLRKALKAEKPPVKFNSAEKAEEDDDNEEEVGSTVTPLPSDTFKAPAPRSKKTVAPLSWSDFFDAKHDVDGLAVYTAGSSGPIVLLLHGAGHTAMSWALVSSLLKESCRVIAYDMRGHGASHVPDENVYSLENLCGDAVKVLETIVAKFNPPETPKVVVVGHSMGGAIAVRVAKKVNPQWLRGLIVIDVVEGTALEALPSMHRIIAGRPSSFPNVETAISWAKGTNMVRNITSARVSIPSQLVATEINNTPAYVWRTDLLKTEPYWKEWFTNLSADFLSVSAPKMLLLAGTDRLDKALTIGQMQGKFQLELIPQVGHVIQEDAPEATFEKIRMFIHKFVAQMPGVTTARPGAGVPGALGAGFPRAGVPGVSRPL